METAVCVLTPNAALSMIAFGTTAGVQLFGLFQSPKIGDESHVASPACAEVRKSIISAKIASKRERTASMFINGPAIVLVYDKSAVVCRAELRRVLNVKLRDP